MSNSVGWYHRERCTRNSAMFSTVIVTSVVSALERSSYDDPDAPPEMPKNGTEMPKLAPQLDAKLCDSAWPAATERVGRVVWPFDLTSPPTTLSFLQTAP